MDLPSHFLEIAGLLLGLVMWYKYNNRRGKALTHKRKGMPPPEPTGAWPVIGHLHLLQGKVPVFRTLAAMADELGPVFVVRLGMFPTLVVSNHEAVKECFTTNDKVLASRPTSAAAKIFGYNYALLPLLLTDLFGVRCESCPYSNFSPRLASLTSPICRSPNWMLESKICTFLAKITTG